MFVCCGDRWVLLNHFVTKNLCFILGTAAYERHILHHFPNQSLSLFVCLFGWLVGWLVGFLTSSSTTRLYRGGFQGWRLTIISAATHKTEPGDHDFCFIRLYYTDTDRQRRPYFRKEKNLQKSPT